MSSPREGLDHSQAQEARAHAALTKTALQRLAVAVVVIVGAFILTVSTSRTDYLSYWSAGKLLRDHADPYSSTRVFALEKAQGYSDIRPLIMRNPPWALFIAAPLGFVGLRIGLFLWTLALMGCVVGSVRLLKLPSRVRAFAYVFAPAVAAIYGGQSAPFVLLGFCLFLRLNRRRPFLAGLSLLLMTLKPHLFLVFWAVLLADCIYRRRFSILAGGAVGLMAGSILALFLDKHVFSHFNGLLHSFLLQHEVFPTISMHFRMLVDPRAFWLLFVPSALATVWGLWYYWRSKHEWQWATHGLLLVLIAILVSPYGWFTDEAVLLPCIGYALANPGKRKYSDWMLLIINTVTLFIVFVLRLSMSSRAYLWTPVTWLAWFLYATYKPERNSTLQTAGTDTPGENSSLTAL